MYFLVADLHLYVVVRPADDLVRNDLLFRSDFAVPAAHEALDGVDRPLGVGDRLPLGRFADERFALFGERHDTGREPVSLLVGNDLRLLALHHGDDGVRRSQIDPDNLFTLSHVYAPFINPI